MTKHVPGHSLTAEQLAALPFEPATNGLRESASAKILADTYHAATPESASARPAVQGSPRERHEQAVTAELVRAGIRPDASLLHRLSRLEPQGSDVPAAVLCLRAAYPNSFGTSSADRIARQHLDTRR